MTISATPARTHGSPVAWAGKLHTRAEIRGTLALLRYYRRFLASDCRDCLDPEDRAPGTRDTMTRGEARRRLTFLIHSSINRKAGIPDVACRRQEPDYWWSLRRDCRAVRDRVNRRVAVYRFDTDLIAARYGHLLSEATR